VVFRSSGVEFRSLASTVLAWWGISVDCTDCLSVNMVLLPSSGMGEFGSATGRSSVDPVPLVSTEPKRRSLGDGRRTARPRSEVIPRSTGRDLRGGSFTLLDFHGLFDRTSSSTAPLRSNTQ